MREPALERRERPAARPGDVGGACEDDDGGVMIVELFRDGNGQVVFVIRRTCVAGGQEERKEGKLSPGRNTERVGMETDKREMALDREKLTCFDRYGQLVWYEHSAEVNKVVKPWRYNRHDVVAMDQQGIMISSKNS